MPLLCLLRDKVSIGSMRTTTTCIEDLWFIMVHMLLGEFTLGHTSPEDHPTLGPSGVPSFKDFIDGNVKFSLIRTVKYLLISWF